MNSTLKTTILLLALLPVSVCFVYAQRGPAYSEMEVNHAGSVDGRVVFEGTPPTPLQLLITKDMEICGEGYRERKEIDVSEDAGLRNVVVYIEKIEAGKSWSEQDSGDSIEQKKCFFQPHVQIIRRGTEIEIINSDSTLHNIHAYEMIGRARRSMFNISQPDMGPILQEIATRRGNRVSLECDSHDFMQGWIFAVDHPYATVVDETGSFEISGIPSGTYNLSAWHPRLGIMTEEITILPDDSLEVGFTYGKQ